MARIAGAGLGLPLPQTLPDGFIYNLQTRGSAQLLFLAPLPIPGASLGRPFPLRKPAGDGNVVFCSAIAQLGLMVLACPLGGNSSS